MTPRGFEHGADGTARSGETTSTTSPSAPGDAQARGAESGASDAVSAPTGPADPRLAERDALWNRLSAAHQAGVLKAMRRLAAERPTPEAGDAQPPRSTEGH
jgi:hypothetical protein